MSSLPEESYIRAPGENQIMNTTFHYYKAFIIVSIIAILMTACSLPSSPQTSPVPTQETPGLIYTSAVKTVIAELTSAASTPEARQTSIIILPLAQAPATQVPATQAPAMQTPTVQTILPPTATPTPQPTAKPSPTATAPKAKASPLPSPTPKNTDPTRNLGDPTFQDKFSDSTNWGFSADSHTEMAIKDGKLVMKAFNPDMFDGWAITWPKTTNFYVELTAAPQTCGGLDHYGLMLRTKLDGSVGYLFGFSCDGRYSFRKWDGVKYTKFIDWTKNSAIQKGSKATNRLGVKAEGDHFILYANGVKINDLHDSSYDQGYFGVFVGAAETANLVVEVSEIDYWELP
jgi:hypothetical protein